MTLDLNNLFNLTTQYVFILLFGTLDYNFNLYITKYLKKTLFTENNIIYRIRKNNNKIGRMVNPSYIAAKIKDLIITNSIERSDIPEFFLVIHKLMPYLSTIGETRMFLERYGESIHTRALPNIDEIALYLRGYNKVTEHIPDPHEQGATFILMKLILLRRSFSMIHYYLHYDRPPSDQAYIKMVVKPYLDSAANSIRIIKEQNFDLNIEERLKKIIEVKDIKTFNRHYQALIELLKIELGAEHPLVNGVEEFWCSQFLEGGAAERARRAEQGPGESAHDGLAPALDVPDPTHGTRKFGESLITSQLSATPPAELTNIHASLGALRRDRPRYDHEQSYTMTRLTDAQAERAIITFFGAAPPPASDPAGQPDMTAEPPHKKLKTKGKGRAKAKPAEDGTSSAASDECECECESDSVAEGTAAAAAMVIEADTQRTRTCAFLRTGRASDMGKRLEVRAAQPARAAGE